MKDEKFNDISKWCYIHICKTGGSYLHKFFSHLNFKHSQSHKKVTEYDFDINKYYTFVCKRNPYQRLHSMFEFYTKQNIHFLDKNIKDFIFNIPEYIKGDGYFLRPQVEYFEIDNVAKVDYIIDFNNLEQSIESFLKLFNLPYPDVARNYNWNINLKKRPLIIEEWDRETIDKANSIYKKDFEFFGYKTL